MSEEIVCVDSLLNKIKGLHIFLTNRYEVSQIENLKVKEEIKYLSKFLDCILEVAKKYESISKPSELTVTEQSEPSVKYPELLASEKILLTCRKMKKQFKSENQQSLKQVSSEVETTLPHLSGKRDRFRSSHVPDRRALSLGRTKAVAENSKKIEKFQNFPSQKQKRDLVVTEAEMRQLSKVLQGEHLLSKERSPNSTAVDKKNYPSSTLSSKSLGFLLVENQRLTANVREAVFSSGNHSNAAVFLEKVEPQICRGCSQHIGNGIDQKSKNSGSFKEFITRTSRKDIVYCNVKEVKVMFSLFSEASFSWLQAFVRHYINEEVLPIVHKLKKNKQVPQTVCQALTDLATSRSENCNPIVLCHEPILPSE